MEYVWVIEQFGADGFRAVIQVFAQDGGAIDYLQWQFGDFGGMSVQREVANGQKRIIVKPAAYPTTTFRITEFQVK